MIYFSKRNHGNYLSNDEVMLIFMTGEIKKFIRFDVFDQNLYRNISEKEDFL